MRLKDKSRWSRKAPCSAAKPPPPTIDRPAPPGLDRRSGNGALTPDVGGGVRRLPSSLPTQPRSAVTKQWQPSPAGPEEAAPPRQTAPPGLPDYRRRRHTLTIRARVGFSRSQHISISLASPAMRGRRRRVNTAFGGTRRLSFFMGLVGRRTLPFFRGASMGRDNHRSPRLRAERLARLMPARPLRRHLAFVRRRSRSIRQQAASKPLRSM